MREVACRAGGRELKPYNKENIPLAKKLRKEMTPQESKLWYEFLRYYPVRVQRQKAIGDYIVDFYCAKARLVIELDGGSHDEKNQRRADAVCTQALEQMNLKIIRICNLDVDRNFGGVCAHIDTEIQKSLPQSPAATAPSSEGGAKYCYAIGVFDGVHMGHQALLKACRKMAAQMGCGCGAITFCSHPDVLVKGMNLSLINTAQERISMLKGQFGMDRVVTLTFDQKLMAMPWYDFFEKLKTEYGAAGLVCGDDFRFGYQGQGDAELLQQACQQENIPCIVVPEQTVDGVRISSTHIRKLIEQGQMEKAVEFMGHPHVFTGTVVSGRKLGRTIGVPTANLLLPEGVVMPKFGVYACDVLIDGVCYMAVTNVGNRPTVGGHRVTVEPWILDFDGDLYGKELTLRFYKFLRPEKKFPSLEALQEEIRKNAVETRNFFKNR